MQIKGVTADSRKVKPGYLYVAIKGVKHDGNDYLKEAASRGAVAAVSDQLNSSPYLPVFHVENARRCLAYRLRNFYGSPSERLRLYGVTGTNGKTTTAFMTEKILAENDLVSGMIGTVIIKMGREVMRAELTTPGAEELNEFLRFMVEKGVTHAVMEVSSQG
ncbi:MAG: Mur ligase family protein, partial [bacterium]